MRRTALGELSVRTFLSGLDEQLESNKIESKKESWSDAIVGGLNNAFIELVATFLLLFGSIYEPHFSPDMLAQLIPGAAILVVIMALKDKNYFCPDGSPMVTLVLLCAGAYTGPNRGKGGWDTVYNQLKSTQVVDVFMRLLGQTLAFVVVYTAVVQHHRGELVNTPFHQAMGLKVQMINEFAATLISCLSVAYCIMPLMKPDADTRPLTNGNAIGDNASSKKNDLSANDDGANSMSLDDPTKYNTFASKKDVVPPKNKLLFSAAIVLAITQIVLERVLRATANPFVYALHCKILSSDQCDGNQAFYVISCQFAGLLVAGMYSYFYMPPARVMALILKE
jgi:hypothetical protein